MHPFDSYSEMNPFLEGPKNNKIRKFGEKKSVKIKQKKYPET